MAHDDDRSVGHVLTRRETLATFGAAAMLAALPKPFQALVPRPRRRLPGCIVRPAQTEGPYFVDTRLDRSDIRSDPASGAVSEGIPLLLTFTVTRISGTACETLPNVLVDVWQCDALGIYSGVKDISGKFDTTGSQFLRGHQRTGADGQATFRTIFPGWYQGRAVHIHFKLRTNAEGTRGHEFTSQLYFDDKVNDQVAAKSPYRTNRQTRNPNRFDRIFQEGGSELMLDVTRTGDGYRGGFDVGLVME
jgi:protocatechuate 3,4-dioxygenase beta subunit